MTLHSIRRVDVDQFGDEAEAGSYLVIDVSFVSTSGTLDVNPGAFSVQDAQGFTYSYEPGVVERDLATSDVASGRQSRGEVAFDVAEGPLLLDYGFIGPPLFTFAFNG